MTTPRIATIPRTRPTVLEVGAATVGLGLELTGCRTLVRCNTLGDLLAQADADTVHKLTTWNTGLIGDRQLAALKQRARM